MSQFFRLRSFVRGATALAATLGLDTAIAVEAESPPPPASTPAPASAQASISKGQAAALNAAADLGRRAAALAMVLSQEQANCGTQREKAKDCAAELLDSLNRLRAVLQQMDELTKRIHQRVAEQQEQPLSDTAWEAFLQLRVAPAAERLAALADEATRDLQAAKSAGHARSSKLPLPAAKAKADPRLEAAMQIPVEAKVLPPPPPPPQRLLHLCKAGQGSSCLSAAGIFEARKELPAAAVWYKLACKHGQKTACDKAAVLKNIRTKS